MCGRLRISFWLKKATQVNLLVVWSPTWLTTRPVPTLTGLGLDDSNQHYFSQHLTWAPSMSGWGLGARQMMLTPDLALQVEACLLSLEDPSLGS